MKHRSERVSGDFSPDNIANYKTLSRRFFADYGTKALFEQNKKTIIDKIIFFIMVVIVFLFCEFGESAI